MLALELIAQNKTSHPSLLKDFIQFTGKNDGQNVIYDATQFAFENLAKINPEDILLGYNNTELETKFKNYLQKISDSYLEINTRYGFVLEDIELRSDFTDLIEKLDTTIQSIVVVNIDSSDFEQFFKPTDPKKPDNPMTARTFIGSLLISYLDSHVKFTRKYGS